ncbi:long-chain fatty acid--CoA ligase [Nocardia sp. BSTN01]|uniref:class I adenylate-forming enzyme family protein n=1 Tax=Nocardia sp. BSTN01 TaxID=2783665 RepID=UPI0018903A88|nr:fatty acid--CoA ligase family protein [Nocardia sp. BSTN01]MBF4997335.1 long-chain fatty acid--CoA ligase [Nocardia sp. BSTN01]
MEGLAAATTWSAQVESACRLGGPALIGQEGRWSGPELLAVASGAAEWLTTLGVAPGTAVPFLSADTDVSVVALTIAGAAIGNPLAPLSSRHTIRELVPAVAGLNSPVLLTGPASADLAGEIAARTGGDAVVVPEPASSATALPRPPAEAIAMYLHTSGTTGAPKPVAMRQDRAAARARVNSTLLDLGPGRVYTTASPWHHIAGAGNVVVALAAGAEVIAAPRFSVQSWREMLNLHPTHALLVPSMIEMLLDAGAIEPGSLRVLQYGGSPIRADTLRRLLEVLPDVELFNFFGQTEGSPITCLRPRDHRLARVGHDHLLDSVGQAAPGVEVRIAEPDEHGVGEVWARADHLMRVDAAGWLRTGDLGRLDADGYLYLSGRKGDKIIRGGENIYPQEIEDALMSHPGIVEAGVVGLPDRRLGQIAGAFLVARDPSCPPQIEELERFLRDRVAGFKVPTSWRFVATLPKTPSGKVQRTRLLDL